ncbi:MAG: LamG-like jellyroll fold domain-containing protein [Armatimonadota bacterium]|nr:LamG-like jellyroll fold domain-containing protein [Armatimonadota bacterium]
MGASLWVWAFNLALISSFLLVSTLLSQESVKVGKILFATFDGERVERNDFGSLQPINPESWRLTPFGTGCPVNPQGRALDAGYHDDPKAKVLSFSIPNDADLRQGTVEMWFKPNWSMGERKHFTLFHIKLRGGYWNGIWLGYHGTIGTTTEAFGCNIMDGVDHPAYVGDSETQLGWKANEWHHVAVTWTEHSLYVFADGKLVAQTFSEAPFRIGENEGVLCVGGAFGETKPLAGGLIDEFRFVNLPLYSPDNPPEPMKRLKGEVDLGFAWLGLE